MLKSRVRSYEATCIEHGQEKWLIIMLACDCCASDCLKRDSRENFHSFDLTTQRLSRGQCI